ncbi:hypothetical protein ACLOJK_007563 [Asimina triloba]
MADPKMAAAKITGNQPGSNDQQQRRSHPTSVVDQQSNSTYANPKKWRTHQWQRSSFMVLRIQQRNPWQIGGHPSSSIKGSNARIQLWATRLNVMAKSDDCFNVQPLNPQASD